MTPPSSRGMGMRKPLSRGFVIFCTYHWIKNTHQPVYLTPRTLSPFPPLLFSSLPFLSLPPFAPYHLPQLPTALIKTLTAPCLSCRTVFVPAIIYAPLIRSSSLVEARSLSYVLSTLWLSVAPTSTLPPFLSLSLPLSSPFPLISHVAFYI